MFLISWQAQLNQFRASIALALLLASVAGCAGPVPGSSAPPTASAPLTLAATPSPSAIQPTASPTPSPTPEGPTTLRVWVPPQFDPQADTSAARLFQGRLNEFSKRRPGVRIEVRVKAVNGPGGILDSLTTASAAAPRALPDLVALPRDLLEAAALKGLLHPYANLSSTMDDADWYPYAQQLAHLQEGVYGLPFAGDALVTVYHLDQMETPPASWPAVLETGKTLIFAAADPQAFFTLALYQSHGGQVRNEQSHPYLDSRTLSDILTVYSQAVETGIMADWMVQYPSDEPVWESFQGGQADLAAVWASFYLARSVEDETTSTNVGVAQIPTASGEPFTLATGWVWALATQSPDRHELGVELAEYLVDSTFLSQWARASGYLPPRQSAIKLLPESPLKQVIDRISLSARLHPGADVLNELGGPLQQAVAQVLKKQNDPLNAAQEAARRVGSP